MFFFFGRCCCCLLSAPELPEWIIPWGGCNTRPCFNHHHCLHRHCHHHRRVRHHRHHSHHHHYHHHCRFCHLHCHDHRRRQCRRNQNHHHRHCFCYHYCCIIITRLCNLCNRYCLFRSLSPPSNPAKVKVFNFYSCQPPLQGIIFCRSWDVGRI